MSEAAETTPVQGSDEWLMQRLGFVTASRFGDAMSASGRGLGAD